MVTETGRAKLTGFKSFPGCITALGWIGCLVRKEPLKVFQTKTLQNTCDEKVYFLVKFQVSL